MHYNATYGNDVQYTILKFSIFLTLLVLNLLAALAIAHDYIDDPASHYLLKYLWMVPVYLLFYTYYRLMHRRMVMSSEFLYIEKANVLALVLIGLLIFTSKASEHYSRMVILVYFGLNFLNPIWVYYLKRYFMQKSRYREDILVICDREGEEGVQSWFVRDNSFGFNIKKTIFVDLFGPEALQQRIHAEVNSHRYYAVVISIATEDTDHTFDMSSYVLHHMHRVYVLPKISKLPLFNSEFFNSINHKGMALYVKNRLLNPTDRTLKEIFDKTLSTALFLVFLPLLILLYLIVFIATKGHPIYKQRRIGQNGHRFNIYKFRTMRLDADEVLQRVLEKDPEAKMEWEREFKLKSDPRITPIGHFLRRTSLDELPQIINVFQGKMSLVGPRPIVEGEIQKYGEYFEYFKAVKPGMTGLWQVSGRNDISYEERVRLDAWYVRNWSIELDIIILVKTAAIVLMRRGSY